MITKSAKEKSTLKNNVHLTRSARHGWEIILKALRPSSKILLPSYIGITDREGSGIYDPVISVGVEHDFYMLNNDLTISLSEIEKCLINSRYDLILLVHYFGFQIQNIEEIVQVCKKYNVIVVEDCAHIYNYNLYDYSDSGKFGDIAFYSLHKNFPFENGGMIVQNKVDVLSLDFSGLDYPIHLAMNILEYDLHGIARKRRENFIILDNLLKDITGIILFRTLKGGDIPHNYPILVENGLREKLYFLLMDRKVPLIALYYRLITPLQNNKYCSMQKISKSILNLPIHQDMDIVHLKFVVESLKNGISELNK